jgi:hypothetical protein
MRNYLADYNEIAVSLLSKETALNTAQTLSHKLSVAKADIIGLDPRRENNADEQTGTEEPTDVYDLGALSMATLNFNKAKAQDFLLAYAYGLGLPGTVVPWGTGYKHPITPALDQFLPSFTAAQRYGQTIMKRLFSSLFVDTISSTFAKDSWAKCVVGVKGTGKYATNMTKETVSAAYNAASLPLAGTTTVQGSDAQARLDNVHQVRVRAGTGEWEEVTYTVVTGAAPSVITITPHTRVVTGTDITFVETGKHITSALQDFVAAGIVQGDAITITDTVSNPGPFTAATVSAHDITTEEAIVDEAAGTATIAVETLVDFEILYVPAETGWMTFPARVVEPPLRVTDLVVIVGGTWNGTAFVGGRTLGPEIDSIEHTLSNQVAIEYRVGGTGTYASYMLRLGRQQTIKLNREAREFILQQRMLDNENFGISMVATGAEFEDGKNYYVKLIFPRCSVLKDTFSVNGKVLAEAGDLQVLQDLTYGSVICEIANKIATAAA